MKEPESVDPGLGQESVWSYPRPPRLEPTDRHIEVFFNGVTIADTRAAWRMLETSHPPTYYIPPEDVNWDYLIDNPRASNCEWKGAARYFDVRVGDRSANAAAWSYPTPTGSFESIRRYVAFYPGAMDLCTVGGEVVRPQPGGFYGGWVTSDVVGPFKGEPGTEFW